MLDKKNFYINGRWIKPVRENNFDVIDPSTEDVVAKISLGSKEDLDIAVSAARKAFSSWKEVTKKEKLDLLKNLLEIYKKRSKEMSEAISMEMGSPIDWSLNVQTASGQSRACPALPARAEERQVRPDQVLLGRPAGRLVLPERRAQPRQDCPGSSVFR